MFVVFDIGFLDVLVVFICLDYVKIGMCKFKVEFVGV